MQCQHCGNEIPAGMSFCEVCGREAEAWAAPEVKPDNVVTGTVGALIGAAIGGASIVLLSQLGYVASISGLILAVCTLKGYELLGGRLSTRGIIISLLLVLVTPYLADRIDWAILVMNAYADMGVTFGEAFAAIPELIREEAIAMADYLKNLLMIYLFVALGAFATLRGAFKK